MPLLPTTLKAQLTTLFNQLAANEDGEQGRQVFIDGLTNAIDSYIRTATVTVTVATAGTAVAQTGGGTGQLS
ncbi:hypothetical protein [Hymenobacter terrenus]|uniref:hypothetical protein n=1 Tax=Hymenobacter terrenus TaxID=1629124 RepID=UPI0006192D91|nr:hypothetical protein [Hymenobacter terrenus]